MPDTHTHKQNICKTRTLKYKLQVQTVRATTYKETRTTTTKYKTFFLPQEAIEDMSHMLENQLFAAAQVIEQQLDQEFDRLDNLDTEDLKALREKRIQEMKKLNNKKQEWLRNVRTEHT